MIEPLRVAVVGAGPAGIYVAEALTAKDQTVPVVVDLLDRLPVPFGLVRYGVAPDHAGIRAVRGSLERILRRPGVRFIGGVEVGADLAPSELTERYDATVFAYGANADRQLGIEGEMLAGCLTSRDLVGWYCGHPDAPIDKVAAALTDARSAVVVGMGNVALDVARILARPSRDLEPTDIPQHALDFLEGHRITDVHIVGRRGPAYASFSTKELRELGELHDVDIMVDPTQLVLDEASRRRVEDDVVLRRNLDLFAEWSRPRAVGTRRIHLHFFARPTQIVGVNRVNSMVLERTAMSPDGSAHGTSDFMSLSADLVILSLGYRGQPLGSLPFDVDRGTLQQTNSRLSNGSESRLLGQYAAGWIKRGAFGVIGTNRKDAAETVRTLLADRDLLDRAPIRDPAGLLDLLRSRGVTTVTIDGWSSIDAAEVRLGGTRGRSRTTIHCREELLQLATGGQPIEEF